jgi:hypothetical protein
MSKVVKEFVNVYNYEGGESIIYHCDEGDSGYVQWSDHVIESHISHNKSINIMNRTNIPVKSRIRIYFEKIFSCFKTNKVIKESNQRQEKNEPVNIEEKKQRSAEWKRFSLLFMSLRDIPSDSTAGHKIKKEIREALHYCTDDRKNEINVYSINTNYSGPNREEEELIQELFYNRVYSILTSDEYVDENTLRKTDFNIIFKDQEMLDNIRCINE